VTVYAFSIDNFKRSQEEVDALMGLAKMKLSELASHGYVPHLLHLSGVIGREANSDRNLLEQYGVKIRFIGRRDMLPQDVLEAVDRMEEMTKGNTKYVKSQVPWMRCPGRQFINSTTRPELMTSGVLNVCSPYTARDETTTAIRESVQEVYDGSLPLR
jgi:ditrans,polycis-polyprenyl diphosphate synthase